MKGSLTAAGAVRREQLRVMRKLADGDTCLCALDQDLVGVFTRRNKWTRPVITLPATHLAHFLLDDLIEPGSSPPPLKRGAETGPCYRISENGRAWWRRQTGGNAPFRDQHVCTGTTYIEEPDRGLIAREVNQGESPLGWLKGRKDANGDPFLTPAEYEAGEQLRRDFEKAALRARTTANWDGFAAPSNARQGSAADVSDMALAARRRLERARVAVGAGLWDVLLETCCYLNGLEQAERALNWPRRSAKTILKIALQQLAAHYGGEGSPVIPERRAPDAPGRVAN